MCKENKFMVKDNSYICIQGWMVSRLGLSGIDLIVYAAIYGFSQDGASVFMGTRAYLAAWCNCSLATIRRSLKSLRDAGLIEQTHHSIDNTEVYYKAVMDPRVKMTLALGSNCTEGRVKMTQGSGQNDPSPRVKMTQHNNIDKDNIEIILVDNLEREGKPRTRFSPPTLEEVKDYAKERNGSVDPVRFFEYYTSNGWMVGKNKMKDWKAAFRNWETREKDETSGGSQKPCYMQNEYTDEDLAAKEEADLAELLGDDE